MAIAWELYFQALVLFSALPAASSAGRGANLSLMRWAGERESGLNVLEAKTLKRGSEVGRVYPRPAHETQIRIQ